MIYYTVAIPLFILSFLSILNKKLTKNSDYIGGFFVLILTIMATVRYKTGTDFDSYTSIYNDINSLFDGLAGREYLEFGFRCFTAFLKTFSDSPTLFFGAMGALTLGLLYFGLKKIEGINIYIALLLYFMIFYISYTFNAMRQAVAMSIFIYSLSYIFEGKFKQVFLLAILASSFHTTGILIIISYFITRSKVNLTYYFIFGTLVSFILYRLSFFTVLSDLFFKSRFHRFLEIHSGGLLAIQLLIRSVISFFFVFVSLYIIKTDVFKKLTTMYLLGYFIYIIFYDSAMLATRFNMFFRVLEIVMFSMILYQSRYLFNRVIVFILISFLAVNILSKDINNPDNEYHSILNYDK